VLENTQDGIHVEEEIKEQELPQAFTTTDFDLTAYLMTLKTADNKQRVLLVAIQPHHRNPNGPGHGYRFTFALQGCEGETAETLKAAQFEYTNRNARVEPIDFMAQRQQLRTLLDAEIQRLNKALAAAHAQSDRKRKG
jgi:hypothetical protein